MVARKRMTTSKTKAPAAKAPKRKATPAAKPEEKREPSLYARVGDDARRKAQREVLLRSLKQHDWNLRSCAAALGLSGTPGVVRALKEVAPDEYTAAKADGRIKPGVRR